MSQPIQQTRHDYIMEIFNCVICAEVKAIHHINICTRNTVEWRSLWNSYLVRTWFTFQSYFVFKTITTKHQQHSFTHIHPSMVLLAKTNSKMQGLTLFQNENLQKLWEDAPQFQWKLFSVPFNWLHWFIFVGLPKTWLFPYSSRLFMKKFLFAQNADVLLKSFPDFP